MTKKINQEELQIILNEYNENDTIELYDEFRDEIGLLEIEKYLLQKYVKYEDVLFEIGCGTGRASFGTYEIGYHKLHAIDLSSGMIERCNEINQLKKYEILFSVCDAISYSGEMYDACVFWFNGLMVIPGRQNRRQCVCNVAKYLKKDGYFIFTTPNLPLDYDWDIEKKQIIKSEYVYVPEYGDRIYDGKYYIHFPQKSEIEELCCNKFAIVEEGICDDCIKQTGRGKYLTWNEKYWVLKKL